MLSLVVVARPGITNGKLITEGCAESEIIQLDATYDSRPRTAAHESIRTLRLKRSEPQFRHATCFIPGNIITDVLMMWGGPGALITRQSASGAPWFRGFDDQSQAARLAFMRVWNVDPASTRTRCALVRQHLTSR